MLMFIFVLFFVIIIATVLILTLKIFLKEKNIKNNNNDDISLSNKDQLNVSNKDQIKVSQDYLPFTDISDDMIDLGSFKYRKIIECTSINYDLKTLNEKKMIEASFARFLNSFQFPITIYIQTRKIDLSNYLETLKENIDETIECFPKLTEYSEQFFLDMKDIPETTGNSKQKKKYIIVGYDEAAYLENLNDYEKKQEALKEINLRVSSLIDNLSGIGIKTKVLNDKDLLELLYYSYNKDDYANFENLLLSNYDSLLVGLHIDDNSNVYVNKNPLADMNDLERTQNALSITKNIIEEEILSKANLNETHKEIYNEVINQIKAISDELNEVMNDYKGDDF